MLIGVHLLSLQVRAPDDPLSVVWKIQTESGMKLPPIESDLDDISNGDISFGDSMKFSYQ